LMKGLGHPLQTFGRSLRSGSDCVGLTLDAKGKGQGEERA
jgi:hypothetical protein